jgi:hypothetical protein
MDILGERFRNLGFEVCSITMVIGDSGGASQILWGFRSVLYTLNTASQILRGLK